MYPDRTKFEVLSNSALFNFRQPFTLQISQNVTTSQATSGRRFASPLATIKVVKADLEITERPSNLHKYNMSVHINIHNENEACVSHIQERVREEMGDQWLLLVGSNGLMFLTKRQLEVSELAKVLHSTEFQHLYKSQNHFAFDF